MLYSTLSLYSITLLYHSTLSLYSIDPSVHGAAPAHHTHPTDRSIDRLKGVTDGLIETQERRAKKSRPRAADLR